MRPQGYLGPSFPHSELIAFYPQTKEKAERVGFEPTRRLNPAYAISSRAPSANSDTSPDDAGRVYQILTPECPDHGPRFASTRTEIRSAARIGGRCGRRGWSPMPCACSTRRSLRTPEYR